MLFKCDNRILLILSTLNMFVSDWKSSIETERRIPSRRKSKSFCSSVQHQQSRRTSSWFWLPIGFAKLRNNWWKVQIWTQKLFTNCDSKSTKKYWSEIRSSTHLYKNKLKIKKTKLPVTPILNTTLILIVCQIRNFFGIPKKFLSNLYYDYLFVLFFNT